MPKKVVREKAVTAAATAASPAAAPAAPEIDLKDSSLYLNRELSLLSFQRRVLEEANAFSRTTIDRLARLLTDPSMWPHHGPQSCE